MKARSILPFVKKHASDTAFSITFLVLLFEAKRDGVTNDAVAKNIYRDVLTDLIPTFRLDIDTPSPKKARYHYSISTDTEPKQSKTISIDPTDIASLLDHCRVMQLTDERLAIMDQLVESSKTVEPSGFGNLFIPLLTRLVELSRVNNISLDAYISNSCSQDVLTLYVQRYIGPEPAKPLDWAQARTGCGCEDCQKLSRFMVDPMKQVIWFPLAEKRRRHLASKLRDTGCTFDTERQGPRHTLVVFKTLSKWQESLNEWKARCKLASQSLSTVGTEAVKQIFGERYEEFASFKALKLGPTASLSDKLESSATSSGPRPPTTASAARPAPAPSFRAPHTAKSKQDVRRTPMSMLSQSISRGANAQEIARIKSTAELREALSKSETGSKTSNLDLPLEQKPSTTATEYIDLTSD